MAAPLTTEIALAVAGVGILLLALAIASLRRRGRESADGRLAAIDRPGTARPSPLLRSERYGLVGRPDELRQRPDGTVVPVEIKSRSAPRRGPPRSHRLQVAAYCLLVEDATGRPPPYGVLRYGDGLEWRLDWDGAARAELFGVIAEMRRPYDGRATPSVARCTACPWRDVCDRRAVA